MQTRSLIIGLFVLVPCLALAQSPDDLQRQLAVQQAIAQEREHQANARIYKAMLEYWQAEAKRLAKENKALKQELEEQKPCEPSSSE